MTRRISHPARVQALARWGGRGALSVLVVATLAACSGFNNTSARWVDAITPYKPDVVQGNFVSKEQAEAIQHGMSRVQVRDILGTPLVASVFHADRWDYVFSIKRRGVDPQHYQFSVFFSNDLVERVEGADLPAETEFVEQLSARRKVGKLPKLEASEEDLAKFRDQAATRRANEASERTTNLPSANVPANYPPLESPR